MIEMGGSMKAYYVTDIKPDEGKLIEDRFLVKEAEIKEGKDGKKFLHRLLSDVTGEIHAKKWNLDYDEQTKYGKIEAGMVITVSGKCREYMGKPQLNLEAIKGQAKEGSYDKKDMYKAAPEEPEAMYDFIVGKINEFEDEDLRALCLSFYEGERDRLMYYPAAKSNHHAEYAGLLYHVKRMMMLGERACEVYPILNRDLLLAGVVLHDIEKLNEIVSDENGVASDYSIAGNMLGHLVMGVHTIGDRCKELGIDEEKCLMVQHMAISHHYEPEFGSPKKPLFPEAEILHYLDMVDAKLFDMEEALRLVSPGKYSDKVFTLDNRKLYKRTF